MTCTPKLGYPKKSACFEINWISKICFEFYESEVKGPLVQNDGYNIQTNIKIENKQFF